MESERLARITVQARKQEKNYKAVSSALKDKQQVISSLDDYIDEKKKPVAVLDSTINEKKNSATVLDKQTEGKKKELANLKRNVEIVRYESTVADKIDGLSEKRSLFGSIQPMSLSDFDRNKALLNCQNGTYSLIEMALLPHNPADYITKMAKVEYIPNIVCERWETFINEIMCGNKETAQFLQKALGYALSGDTSLECFFIFYGNSTRNGKSALTETISNILADYDWTKQPQTLARRSNDGSSPSPDIARLKGARLVNTPEPEKGLELNTVSIKQLTGGDTYTGRFLHENAIEYKPEEQDTKLKWQFRKSYTISEN